MSNYIKLNEEAMAFIKVKQVQLFNFNALTGLELNVVNSALNKLIMLPAKSAALKYDLSIKLSKAVDKAIAEFHEQHKKLLEDSSTKKVVVLNNGNEFETYYKIVDVTENEFTEMNNLQRKDALIASVDGIETDTPKRISINAAFDIKDMADLQKRFSDMLNLTIELNCYPIKLSKLEAEEDCSQLDFSVLEPFLLDDINA